MHPSQSNSEGCIMRASRVGSVNERFAQRYVINAETGCWDWSGSVNATGYGLIGGEINGKRYAPKGQRMLAHRVSWIIHRGDIPKGEGAHGTIVMHKCDNPACVNPEHLALGTQMDNVRDMDQKARRITRAKTGIEHWNSAFASQADIDFICSQKGRTKELAEKYGVTVGTIKRVRARAGLGSTDPEKYRHKKLDKETVDRIRNDTLTQREMVEKYGLSRSTILNIRMGRIHNY